MTKDEKRSKLYSYFYGKNTIFQAVMLGVAVLFLLMATLTALAPDLVLARLENKLKAIQEVKDEAYSDYSAQCKKLRNLDIDYEYEKLFDLKRSDENYQAKKAYNEALEDYQKAWDKYEVQKEKNELKAEKFSEYDPFMDTVYLIFGILLLIVALAWFLFKKFILRDSKIESLYDKELSIKIEEAKARGLEKLNILSEQVEQVEPVVLNGVAETDENMAVKAVKSKLKRKLIKLAKIAVFFGLIVLLLLPIFWLTTIGSPMAIQHILVLGICGGIGFLAYTKFELQTYVRPQTIDKLDKFPPHLVSRIGVDDKERVTLPSVTVYMFGEEQLYIYYQYFNIITGKIFCEGVHEYFYEDIVGIISVQDQKIAFKHCGFLNLFWQRISYLKESISVVSSGCTHRETYFVDIGCSLLDTQFTAMRNLIRQKKESK